MRRFTLRFAQLSILSFVITLGYVLFPQKTYVHPSEWGATTPTWESDYRETTVWGQPFYFIIDNPQKPGAGLINTSDRLSGGVLFVNWVFWLIVTTVVYIVALGLVGIPRRLKSFAKHA